MQAMMGAVNSYFKVGVASRPKYNGLLPALIHRPVTYQPDVAVD
jgi:hypothetical protein